MEIGELGNDTKEGFKGEDPKKRSVSGRRLVRVRSNEEIYGTINSRSRSITKRIEKFVKEPAVIRVVKKTNE